MILYKKLHFFFFFCCVFHEKLVRRALTRHLTPPIENTISKTEVEVSNIESIQTLVNSQNEQVLRLLNIVQEVSPKLLGTDALKISKGRN